MSNSEVGPLKTLQVSTRDEAAEIFIINAHFHMVAHDTGMQATFELPAGVYTVIMRTGDRSIEQIAALYPNDLTPQVVDFPDEVAFFSAAPIHNSKRTHEYHEDAAAETSQRVTAQLGTGSSIFVMARDWSSPSGPHGAKIKPVENPAAGLTLRSLEGEELFNFERQSENNFKLRRSQDPWAAARVEVDPGAYRLSLELPNQNRIEMTIIAVDSWQTQVCLLQTDLLNPPAKIRRANLVGASIFMSKNNYPYQPGAPDKLMRTADLAQQGLTKRRPVLKQDIYDILVSKCEDPFLGITGMHLFLRDPSYEVGWAQGIVTRLREVMGSVKHPDVEAMAWKVGLGDPTYIFNAPPMIRASWDMVLEASTQHPESVPASSLTAQISNRIWGSGAWLTWQLTPRTGEASDRLSEAESQALTSLVEETMPKPKEVEGLDAGIFFGIPAEPPEPDAETVEKMVKMLRIPASQVRELLKKR